MKLTEESREIIENCLYTFASLVYMHDLSERPRDVETCLQMIEQGLDEMDETQ